MVFKDENEAKYVFPYKIYSKQKSPDHPKRWIKN